LLGENVTTHLHRKPLDKKLQQAINEKEEKQQRMLPASKAS